MRRVAYLSGKFDVELFVGEEGDPPDIAITQMTLPCGSVEYRYSTVTIDRTQIDHMIEALTLVRDHLRLTVC